MNRSLAISLLVHVNALLLLIVIPVSTPVLEPPERPRRVTLLSPFPARAPVKRRVPRPRPQAHFIRRSTAPILLRPAAPRTTFELPIAPALDTARPALPGVEPARLPSTPPRPLRTDNLAEADAAVPLKPPPKPAVKTGGFDTATVSERATPPAAGETAAAQRKAFAESGFTPVEIISKPRPSYTEEARRLRIEGEVSLDMMFGASGEARVVRIVTGLGHGLDENAIAAARVIRFRPAQRGGEPVDSAAIVHIIFQLAY